MAFIVLYPAIAIFIYAYHHAGFIEKCLVAKTDGFGVLFHRPDRTQEAEQV